MDKRYSVDIDLVISLSSGSITIFIIPTISNSSDMNSVTAGTAALTSTTAAASTIGGRLCKIVLTGGPGGGKSTALTKLRNRLVHRGLQVMRPGILQ